ncbi:MAG: hypothetical protein FWD57_05230 [Polyangiaceae bacterium]|nr:hypothetical protein [Polyangiaceae bacterium]
MPSSISNIPLGIHRSATAPGDAGSALRDEPGTPVGTLIDGPRNPTSVGISSPHPLPS